MRFVSRYQRNERIEDKKSPFSLKIEEYEEWGFYRKKISLNAHFFLWLLRRAIHNFDLKIVWQFLHLYSMLRFKTMPDGWIYFLFSCINDACMINVSPDHCKLVTDRGILGSRRSNPTSFQFFRTSIQKVLHHVWLLDVNCLYVGPLVKSTSRGDSA